MKKTVVLFGSLICIMLSLFQLGTYAVFSPGLSPEIILVAVAVIFFLTGTLLNYGNLQKKQPVQQEINTIKLQALALSTREYQVLKEIAFGLSNKEIATKLYLTESTIKTHVSNLFVKLNAKRRTQAIQIAKKMGII